MNVAIIYDAVTEFGGAERMLQSLLRLFPAAHVFTAFADRRIIPAAVPSLSRENLHTLPHWVRSLSTHTSLFQALAPYLWRQFNLDAYDLIISKPSHLMCNLIRTKAVHIQYIHTPPKNIFGLVPITPLQRLLTYQRYVAPLYKRAIRKTPYLLTNSYHMQRTIRRLLGVSPKVLYPPVTIPGILPTRGKGQYYVCVSRLDSQKHIEIAIRACNRLTLPLRIVGVTNEPRYEQFLRRIAGPTIRFLGFRSDQEIQKLYAHAIAFLFTSKEEDFGITPLEAIAHGVPVIAYYGGGVKETVKEGVTGRFFHTHSPTSLMRVLRRFDASVFRPNVLYGNARQFEERAFHAKLGSYINAVFGQSVVTLPRR